MSNEDRMNYFNRDFERKNRAGIRRKICFLADQKATGFIHCGSRFEKMKGPWDMNPRPSGLSGQMLFLTFGFKMEPDGTKIWPFGIEISRKCIVVFKVFEELAKFGWKVFKHTSRGQEVMGPKSTFFSHPWFYMSISEFRVERLETGPSRSCNTTYFPWNGC